MSSKAEILRMFSFYTGKSFAIEKIARHSLESIIIVRGKTRINRAKCRRQRAILKARRKRTRYLQLRRALFFIFVHI